MAVCSHIVWLPVYALVFSGWDHEYVSTMGEKDPTACVL